MSVANRYRDRFTSLKDEIHGICERSGREQGSVRVVAVTKYVTSEAMEPLWQAGMREFAENRWQQAKEKFNSPLASLATWHFIGRLQKNKVKQVVSRFDWIHSIDSLELAEEVSRSAVLQQRTIRCLLQVNISEEASKTGFSPNDAKGCLEAARLLPGIEWSGLMTMAPLESEVERTRPIFAGLRDLRDSIRQELDLPAFYELSMGMSNDYSIAIEEGATIVRIGRRLVGED